MLRTAHSPRLVSRRRAARVAVSRTNGSAAVADARKHAEIPERMTECLKHRIEAEARYNLLRSIRGVGTAR